MWSTNTSETSVTNNNTKFDISCIVVLVISIIGVIGNTVTLFAFQYARLKRKYNFHTFWNRATIFIWNLALVDLLSSINMTAMYVQLVFRPTSINNKVVCVSQIMVRDIFVLISASSVACIAVVAMVGVTKNILWNNF